MPEGDTILRAARTLNETLAGRTVTRFESVFSRITRADDGLAIRGRTIERVDARGKHLLIWFSGDVVLRTHMRMHGVWHLYRHGARWRRPHSDMRIVIGTPEYEAVAFNVPVAELTRGRDLSLEDITRVVEKARRLMRTSVAGRRMAFSVYGRGGQPCRRCGAVIAQRKGGDASRVTYWCPRCQAPRDAANARTV